MDMRFSFFSKERLSVFAQYGMHDNGMSMHTHADFCELVLVTDGTADNVSDSGTVPIRRGDVLFFGKGSSHAFENTFSLRICNIMFIPEEILPNFTKVPSLISGGEQRVFHLPHTIFSDAEKLAAKIIEENNTNGEYRTELINAYFTELAVFLSRMYEKPVTSREISGISEAAMFIEKHYMDEYPIKQALTLSHYSRRHFSRLFSEIYSISPQQYLMNIRLQHAGSMLIGTEMPIADIAAACGFTDASYFSRVFKSSFGMLPSSYRSRK